MSIVSGAASSVSVKSGAILAAIAAVAVEKLWDRPLLLLDEEEEVEVV
jgi:hypothetical protein